MKVPDTDTCIGILRERNEVVTTWVTASGLFFDAARSVQPESNAALVVRFSAAA